MDAQDVRAYAGRGWAAAETRKQRHWAREFNERGPAVTFKAAVGRWRHMRLVDPDWPSDDERHADLAHQ